MTLCFQESVGRSERFSLSVKKVFVLFFAYFKGTGQKLKIWLLLQGGVKTVEFLKQVINVLSGLVFRVMVQS